jgi:hypothetical protein
MERWARKLGKWSRFENWANGVAFGWFRHQRGLARVDLDNYNYLPKSGVIDTEILLEPPASKPFQQRAPMRHAKKTPFFFPKSRGGSCPTPKAGVFFCLFNSV